MAREISGVVRVAARQAHQADGLSMARFDVNCSILFTELPILQRPAAARAAGFTAVEFSTSPFPTANSWAAARSMRCTAAGYRTRRLSGKTNSRWKT
jgi:hypothetical protein